MLTVSELKALLTYDPDAGVFRWLVDWQRVRIGDIAGSKDFYGYTHIQVQGKKHKTHRLAWFYMTGDWPKQKIDHINGVKDDNRWGNLREASSLNNSHNAKLHQGKTIPKGVSRSGRKYRARIRVLGKLIYLGTFDRAELAHAAYCGAAKTYFGDFASGG